MKKRLALGILAHVDAGKTTLSEGILYLTGSIRKLGRVDNRDAFLDTYELERARGITIFSKQAVFELGDSKVTLLDTPGHVDFSAEMERTLQVLDYAVLVVSGADGVQGHTETLWRLLQRYHVPVFVFVNKMDQNGTDRDALMAELKKRLHENCVAFDGEGLADRETWLEEVAMCDETVLERYLEEGDVEEADIRRLIVERKVFPCFFGSALKLLGVEELLKGIEKYGVTIGESVDGETKAGVKGNAAEAAGGAGAPGQFGARVYKISRDEQGNRLTHMKIVSGVMKVKDMLVLGEGKEEKVNQIRIYSGTKFEAVNQAEPGDICAVTGPVSTYAGQALGAAAEGEQPMLEPVLTYQIILPEEVDAHVMLGKLRQLEEEEPQLHIVWNEALGEIQAQVMGEVQIEVLRSLIGQRFGVDVRFGAGNIVYKETIARPMEGVGHYEPLRHYSEVHLWMEPGEPGSGLQFDTDCSEDVLDRNWQRLIMTHLEEKKHVGVLTGAEITDMKITLIAGKAHLKHTEGGDFRQSTYRAVRQGLMEAGCRLLEPHYQFRLEVPSDCIGRAMTDIERMYGKFQPPELDGEMAVICGSGPVAAMRDYQMEVISYTRGRGKWNCSLKGYELCHNEAEIVAAAGYDPELDLDNPTGSVFCAHGAGFVVPWDMVKDYMHVESPVALARRRQQANGTVVDMAADMTEQDTERRVLGALGSSGEGGRVTYMEVGDSASRAIGGGAAFGRQDGGSRSGRDSGGGLAWGAEDKELEAIFTRTYGERKKRTAEERVVRRVSSDSSRPYRGKTVKDQEKEYLLVDGYNIIFAWEELRELAKVTVDGARQKLMDILCNYQGYKKCTLILVFDAYKVEGNLGQALTYNNIHVVYTKEAETADQYIEKLAHQMGRQYQVTVATSDGLEQLIIRGQGCRLLSAQDLREEIEYVNHEIRTEHLEQLTRRKSGNYLFGQVEPELAEYLEDVRLGKEDAPYGGKTDKK